MADGAPDAGQGIAVLGGTFNPLHVGHLRLAIEVHEAFAGMVSRVDILPNSRPPHKANAAILPFAIRAALIREACTPYPWRLSPLHGSGRTPGPACGTFRPPTEC